MQWPMLRFGNQEIRVLPFSCVFCFAAPRCHQMHSGGQQARRIRHILTSEGTPGRITGDALDFERGEHGPIACCLVRCHYVAMEAPSSKPEHRAGTPTCPLPLFTTATNRELHAYLPDAPRRWSRRLHPFSGTDQAPHLRPPTGAVEAPHQLARICACLILGL